MGKREHEMGRYSRGVSKKEEAPQEKKLDMVEALLANESARKKEKEIKAKQEEEIAKKKKDLRAMSVEELKKALEKKGLEVPQKKDEMIETLFEANIYDEDGEDDMEAEEEEEEEVSEEEKVKRREKEVVVERTKELKLMYMDDLK